MINKTAFLEFNPVFDPIVKELESMMVAAEPGHDWLHICRVLSNARSIAKSYHQQVEILVVEGAILLHDIVDSKFFSGTKDEAIAILKGYLDQLSLSDSQKESILEIIDTMSFSKTLDKAQSDYTIEYQIVRDADRLDALGAIGVARTFSFGAIRNNRFYDFENDGFRTLDFDTYKNRASSTVQHFYDKLLTLKDTMLTPEAKTMAESRTQFLYQFLEQLKNEINDD
jgi:uncharacterized protein